MNTSNNAIASLSDSIAMLSELTKKNALKSVLDELQLVVERITFSRISEKKNQASQAVFAELDLYFEEEVSSGMMQFIRWFASNDALHALAEENGRRLLEYCILEYRKIQEVKFISAISLDESQKRHVESRLRTQFPEPARIIFDISPQLMVGFIIEAGDESFDASLKTHITTQITRGMKFNTFAASLENAHG